MSTFILRSSTFFSFSYRASFITKDTLPCSLFFDRCKPPSQYFNVVSTLFQRWKMKQNPTSDFQRCTTLLQRQCPTLKQHRNNVAQRCFNLASTLVKAILKPIRLVMIVGWDSWIHGKYINLFYSAKLENFFLAIH